MRFNYEFLATNRCDSLIPDYIKKLKIEAFSINNWDSALYWSSLYKFAKHLFLKTNYKVKVTYSSEKYGLYILEPIVGYSEGDKILFKCEAKKIQLMLILELLPNVVKIHPTKNLYKQMKKGVQKIGLYIESFTDMQKHLFQFTVIPLLIKYNKRFE